MFLYEQFKEDILQPEVTIPLRGLQSMQFPVSVDGTDRQSHGYGKLLTDISDLFGTLITTKKNLQ